MAAEVNHPGASASAYYVAKSDKCIGAGIFAGCTYGAGERIATFPRPLVGSLDTQRLEDTCANCYTWTEGSSIGSRLYVKNDIKVQTCAGCKRFRYCSKRCQKEAWNRGHKHECKNLRPLSDKEIPKAVLATMEILVRRKHGLIPDHTWEMLCRLDGHLDDFKQNGKYGGIELMAMGTSQYSWTQDTFNKEFVAAMYGRVLTNALTLITPTLDPLGIVIDPVLCHINHSCDPNAYIMMDGAEVSVRTLKPIKEAEEIYISYIDTTNPYARRQNELESRWFFACKCAKCDKGEALAEDEWAIEPSKLPQEWKEVLDKMVKTAESTSDSATFAGKSQDEKRVEMIQRKAFHEHENAQSIQDSAAAIKAIEEGMHVCHQSKLWPLYRQPYAALRDDLIVNKLLVGDFEEAWAHCAKRYRHITPKLYPQKAHPIRVAQTWQMAMLALYLAEIGGSQGVDLGLIAYLLVKDLNDVIDLSHGSNSSFTKSVKKKYEEMRAEMHRKLGSDADTVVGQQSPRQWKLLLDMGDSVEY